MTKSTVNIKLKLIKKTTLNNIMTCTNVYYETKTNLRVWFLNNMKKSIFIKVLILIVKHHIKCTSKAIQFP